MKRIYDMLVIGGGPGGYAAALYAARAGLSVAVLEKLSAGGQMALTDNVDNYPGFPEGIDGFSLGENMQLQAERFGAETVLTEVLELDLAPTEKAVRTGDGMFWGKTVVFSTGASPRKMGLANEEFYTGKGLHYCAACDGMRYRGKTVAVIGGGDSAVADALSLSRVAETVILVHRRDSLRATKVYHKALEDAPNVQFRWNSEVTEFLGEGKLSGIRLRNVQTGEETQLPVDGAFVSIGREPATDIVKGQLELDGRGYILAGENTATSLPGVYAVGDVRNKALRQIVTAVADGAYAAYEAEHYLSQQ